MQCIIITMWQMLDVWYIDALFSWIAILKSGGIYNLEYMEMLPKEI